MKIKIEVTHVTDGVKSSNVLEGILDENKISYYEDNSLVEIVLEKEKILLTKSNNDYKITINFLSKKVSIMEYESKGQILCMKVFTNELEKEEKIVIKYMVEDTNSIEYYLNYEEIM